MFNVDGKYGTVHIQGKSIDIEKTKVEDLEKYLKELEKKEENLLNQQNDYLSKIL